MNSIQRKTKDSLRFQSKKLLKFHSGCHGMKISIVSNRNVASAARDLVSTSIKPLPFSNCIEASIYLDIGDVFIE